MQEQGGVRGRSKHSARGVALACISALVMSSRANDIARIQSGTGRRTFVLSEWFADTVEVIVPCELCVMRESEHAEVSNCVAQLKERDAKTEREKVRERWSL